MVGRSIWNPFTPGLLIIVLSITALSQTSPEHASTFRWIQPNSDPQIWQQIQSAFQPELAPDVAKQGDDGLDVYRYKYLQRIGVLNHSALVLVGHRPAKHVTKENAWDEYYSAFNFNLVTQQKTSIDHANWMWQWKFSQLAKFGPFHVPDVTFTYLSCTECEPEVIFGSLRYEAAKSVWYVRSWGDGKDIWWATDEGLIVGMDANDGGDTISYDCVYRILNSARPGFQDLAIRCKMVSDGDAGRAQVEDSTLLYSSSNGEFYRRLIRDQSEAAALNTKMCRSDSQSLLCKLPWYLTFTSGQNSALDQMFPNKPKTYRELDRFRKLNRSMSIADVVLRCGEPDEIGGSGISIFVYHLSDGSLVAIGATDTTKPILYANHIETSGKASALIPE